ncbi:hypothetical protein J6590_091986, partial [Homalodisca vitripennis]
MELVIFNVSGTHCSVFMIERTRFLSLSHLRGLDQRLIQPLLLKPNNSLNPSHQSLGWGALSQCSGQSPR